MLDLTEDFSSGSSSGSSVSSVSSVSSSTSLPAVALSGSLFLFSLSSFSSVENDPGGIMQEVHIPQCTNGNSLLAQEGFSVYQWFWCCSSMVITVD